MDETSVAFLIWAARRPGTSTVALFSTDAVARGVALIDTVTN